MSDRDYFKNWSLDRINKEGYVPFRFPGILVYGMDLEKCPWKISKENLKKAALVANKDLKKKDLEGIAYFEKKEGQPESESFQKEMLNLGIVEGLGGKIKESDRIYIVLPLKKK